MNVSFQAEAEGMFMLTGNKKAEDRVRLSNFTAVIRFAAHSSDGIAIYGIEAAVSGKLISITVRSEEFPTMRWLHRLGPEAIAEPGSHRLDQLRAAIQYVSKDIVRVPIFTRLGWHLLEGRQVFVHAEGVIDSSAAFDTLSTANGVDAIAKKVRAPVPTWIVDIPPALSGYKLPAFEPATLQRDIQSALELLEIAPLRISLPLFASVWHATMFEPDFAIHVAGPSGNLKTELVGLVASFFGAELNARQLAPGWSSTANYIRDLLAIGQNVMVPVDDFLRTGSAADISRMEHLAEEVLRDVGNHMGRGRSNPWGKPNCPRRPAGMLISTGESSPGSMSLRARYLNVAIETNEVIEHLDRQPNGWSETLSAFKRQAAAGVFARVTTAFVTYLCRTQRSTLPETRGQAEQLRSVYAERKLHPRNVEMVSSLHASFEEFLTFAQHAGAIENNDSDRYFHSATDAFRELLDSNAELQAETDPCKVFVDTLASLLLTGKVWLDYLSDKEWDNLLDLPHLWGYRAVSFPDGDARDPDAGDTGGTRVHWMPTSTNQIGWKDYDTIHLDPEQSFAAVQAHLRKSGAPPIALSVIQLGKRLVNQNIVPRTQTDRNRSAASVRGVKHSVFSISIYRFHTFLDNDGLDDPLALGELETLGAHKASLERLRKKREVYENIKEVAHDFFSEALWLYLFSEPLQARPARREPSPSQL